jgi:hypothetical protein
MFHRVRSELLLSASVLCLPRTACLRRSSSTTSGLLLGGVILILKRAQFLYAIDQRLPFYLCKHILDIMLKAQDENNTSLPFSWLITQIILQYGIDVSGEPKMKIKEPISK